MTRNKDFAAVTFHEDSCCKSKPRNERKQDVLNAFTETNYWQQMIRFQKEVVTLFAFAENTPFKEE